MKLTFYLILLFCLCGTGRLYAEEAPTRARQTGLQTDLGELTASAAVAAVDFTAADLSAAYQQGRKVCLSISNSPFSGYSGRTYAIYRDGVKLAEFAVNSNGTLPNGDYWSWGTYSHYFYDLHATPGQTHEYRVDVTLSQGGPVVSAEKSLAIPGVDFATSDLSVSYQQGRKVYVSIQNDKFGGFPERTYTIYRDGVELVKDEVIANGSWSWSSAYIYDLRATPGATHEYRVEVTLYAGGPVFSATASFAVPMPGFTASDLVARYTNGRNAWLMISHRNLQSFPERSYKLYRDDVELAEFAVNTAGTLANGDRWQSGGDAMYYYDANAVLDTDHEYKVVAALYDGGPTVEARVGVSVPMPVVQNSYVTVSQGIGREVHVLIFNDLAFQFPDVVYEVRRDGVKLGESRHGGNDILENGDYWLATNRIQYFYDRNHGAPGAVHEYTVTFRFKENVTLEVRKNHTAAPVIAGDWARVTSRHTNGVTLDLKRFDGFPDLSYDIYRDGALIASIPGGSEGSNANGRWEFNRSYQKVIDTSASPGVNHLYSVVCNFYEGVSRWTSFDVTVDDAQPTNESGSYVSTIKRLPSGEYLLAISIRKSDVLGDAPVRIDTLAGSAAFLDTGLPSVTLASADFSASGYATVYFVAPASLDFENDVFDFQVWSETN